METVEHALVVGATGLVGRHLVDLLLDDERFKTVTILVRRPSGRNHSRLTEHVVDFDDEESWAHLLTGDVLFSAMGTTRKAAGSQDAQYRVDVAYQLEVAYAAAGFGTKRYVLVSAAGADDHSRFFYPRIKGELEKAVLSLGFDHVTILRPSILEGQRSDSRFMEQLGAKLVRFFGHFSRRARRYRPIHANIVAQAMIRAALYPTNEHRIVELDDIFALAGDAVHN